MAMKRSYHTSPPSGSKKSPLSPRRLYVSDEQHGRTLTPKNLRSSKTFVCTIARTAKTNRRAGSNQPTNERTKRLTGKTMARGRFDTEPDNVTTPSATNGKNTPAVFPLHGPQPNPRNAPLEPDESIGTLRLLRRRV